MVRNESFEMQSLRSLARMVKSQILEMRKVVDPVGNTP
jgi:hypothetical protein